MTEVVQYKYVWDLTLKEGFLKFQLKGKKWSRKWFNFPDPSEFEVVIGMLQNEKPVYYGKNDAGFYSFQTTREPVGEVDNNFSS